MSDFVFSDGGKVAAGFADERLDCTVRALSIAAGHSYAVAHKHVAVWGERKRRHKVRKIGQLVRAYGECYNLRALAVSDRLTVRRWLDLHDVGDFIVRHRGHVMAVRDGVVHDDHPPKLRARVTHAWAASPAL